MADESLVRLLACGPSTWNDQRPRGKATLDLTHLKINNADLVGIDLHNADLNGTLMQGVDARRADLSSCKLNGMNIEDCRLVSANMTGSEFLGTNLTRVDLQQACMRGARFRELKIRHSNLSSMDLCQSVIETIHLFNCDLTGAAFREIRLTDDAFFRRVIIESESMRDLAAQGFRFQAPNEPRRLECLDAEALDSRLSDAEDVGRIEHKGRAYWIAEGRFHFFVSHATADKADIALPLKEALEQRGMRVWYDVDQVRLVDGLASVISYGIRSAIYGVIIVSPRFFARRWTEFELDALMRRPDRIVLIAHEIAPESLGTIRPSLADRYIMSSQDGLDSIADRLVKLMSEPPRELGDAMQDRSS